MKRKLSMCVCSGEGVLTIFYSSQAHMKKVWNPLLHQIDITEQYESLCKIEIIYENQPEPTLGFDRGTE